MMSLNYTYDEWKFSASIKNQGHVHKNFVVLTQIPYKESVDFLIENSVVGKKIGIEQYIVLNHKSYRVA